TAPPANSFAVAWLAVLLLNPTDIFTAGCQLSFLAVAILNIQSGTGVTIRNPVAFLRNDCTLAPRCCCSAPRRYSDEAASNRTRCHLEWLRRRCSAFAAPGANAHGLLHRYRPRLHSAVVLPREEPRSRKSGVRSAAPSS